MKKRKVLVTQDTLVKVLLVLGIVLFILPLMYLLMWALYSEGFTRAPHQDPGIIIFYVLSLLSVTWSLWHMGKLFLSLFKKKKCPINKWKARAFFVLAFLVLFTGLLFPWFVFLYVFLPGYLILLTGLTLGIFSWLLGIVMYIITGLYYHGTLRVE